MIDRHHQILQGDLPTDSLANTLRIADLADFSWGWLRGPVPTAYIKQVQSQYPNAGFHLCLLRFTLDRLRSHPLNPAPMMRLK